MRYVRPMPTLLEQFSAVLIQAMWFSCAGWCLLDRSCCISSAGSLQHWTFCRHVEAGLEDQAAVVCNSLRASPAKRRVRFCRAHIKSGPCASAVLMPCTSSDAHDSILDSAWRYNFCACTLLFPSAHRSDAQLMHMRLLRLSKVTPGLIN